MRWNTTDVTAENIPRPHVLREYAFLAGRERGVLVGPHGNFAWMCAPRWHSVHPSGAWQQAPDAAGVDAALLLPAIRGGVPADDPRSLATYRAVERELCTDYYVYRYRHDEPPLETNEDAFLFCGFVMAIAAAQLGQQVSAARYFERNRVACGTPGLFAEEFDVRQRQLRGNMPQAFVHAVLFESSVQLTRFAMGKEL